MLAIYWTFDRPVLNLGDHLTEVFIEAFGYAFLSFESAAKNNRLEEFETCLFAVGSILDSAWCERVKMKKSIWGSGDWGDPRFGRTHLDDCTLHAVRGPLTVRRLGLPEATPTGDPALLLPVLFPLSRQSDTGVIFIPHFNRRTAFSASAIASAGASRLVDFGVTRAERSARIRSIVDAEFVLTGSLHGAIVAQAYGRPWALCLPDGVRQDKPGKWEDWFAYLGLEPASCRNHEEGRRWWLTHGCRGTVKDLRPMMRALPFPILDPVTRRIWEAAC